MELSLDQWLLVARKGVSVEVDGGKGFSGGYFYAQKSLVLRNGGTVLGSAAVGGVAELLGELLAIAESVGVGPGLDCDWVDEPCCEGEGWVDELAW